MKKIGFLTEQIGYSRGACDFYPIIKWKNQLKESGLDIRFYRSHHDRKLMDNEIVCLDQRYHMHQINIHNRQPDKQFIINYVKKLKNQGIKVVLFDNLDGTGSRDFDLIPFVDLFVKKQLLKNRTDYTVERGYQNLRRFTESYDLSDKQVEINREKGKQFVACPEEHLHKLRLGWNIGMLDYREFPFSKYYPIGTTRLLNRIYKLPFFSNNFIDRPIDSGFRGEVKSDNENYSWQRNKLIEFLRSNKGEYNFISGNGISKTAYLEELRKSKTCVSPFGYGEICYRDFEATLCGCLLIKPDMSHIDTYPDIYRKKQTYVDIRWDMSDLDVKLKEVLENYESYKTYVQEAQEIFKKEISDPERFIEHFKSVLV